MTKPPAAKIFSITQLIVLQKNNINSMNVRENISISKMILEKKLQAPYCLTGILFSEARTGLSSRHEE
jgi:hypothetical protein